MTNSKIPSRKSESTNFSALVKKHLEFFRGHLGYFVLAVLYAVVIGLGMGSIFALLFFYGIGTIK